MVISSRSRPDSLGSRTKYPSRKITHAARAQKATVRFEIDGQPEIHEEADDAIRDLELVIRQYKLSSKN